MCLGTGSKWGGDWLSIRNQNRNRTGSGAWSSSGLLVVCINTASMPMISVLGKMFLWQREGPGGRWTCQTSRRGETRGCRCDLGGDGKLRSRVLRWQEENYSGFDIGNRAETGTTRLGPDRVSGKRLGGLG